jgi:hypothetical protein
MQHLSSPVGSFMKRGVPAYGCATIWTRGLAEGENALLVSKYQHSYFALSSIETCWRGHYNRD